DQAAHLVTELQLSRALGEPTNKVLVHAALDIDPLCAHTRLSCIEERGEQRTVDGSVEIGIREHEHRVPAPELEHRRTSARGRCRCYTAAYRYGAGEEHLRDTRISDERGADLRFAVHDLHEPGRRARFFADAWHPLRGQGC